MVLLTNHIFTILAIISFIWISPSWTWNLNDRRYDGYDLERGPVFYEAYYPENNDNNPSEYQEKRYFDRDPVIERTFQIPTDRKEYMEDRSKNEYLDRLEYLRYDNSYNPDPKLSRIQNYPRTESSRNYEIPRKFYDVNSFSPNYMRLIRNIPDDSLTTKNIDNWNTLGNYYLRFDPNFDKSDINSRSNFRGIPDRSFLNQENMFEKRNDEKNVESIRDIQQNLSAASPRAIQPLEMSKEFDSIRRLSPRDLQNHNSFDTMNSINYIRYPGQEYNYIGNRNDPETEKWIPQNLSNEQMEGGISRNVNSLPSENIFAPRPQVINYVFSKDSSIERTEKPITTIKEITNNDEPRKYGDNLLQEELNKEEENKDNNNNNNNTKVTSIEISEVPRHKIRHHHGEWLRNFSHGQK